ncbi:biliverdin-producing heme oxygenase [Hymenobacter volaticus]|uniref:Biliverdin-producing heme oxygenase n=1 Tax=Hymenobacter volaticus TaxID=2932254 RepID=A0ABY4GFN5_9BACT|nr:biliverdin-producing heme oxygenase [Hymenobacter volaticus]UOQ69662.1 biliverdin-producing heme oxygenase [Hymenobacter volaticus]
MTTPLSTEILSRLRTETRPYHEALEQNRFNQNLTAGTPTQELTEWFLQKMYGFLVPYEQQLRRHTWPPAWQVERRYRAHLILEDLPHTSPTALPLCTAMPSLHTWPELLGAMYVIEGSTLGGQVIARQLTKAGISTRTYFSGYGDQTGLMWKSFCQLLGQAAMEVNQDEIVLSARRTFQHLDAWLNHP